MKVNVQKKGDFNIIIVSDVQNGQVDVTNIKKLKEKFYQMFEKGTKHIAINLINVMYVDSSTIGFFVDSLNMLRNSGGELALINVKPKIIELLEMTNLAKFLPIFKREEEFFEKLEK